MRVLIITLSFAIVVLGKKFLVETENSKHGKDYYGGGSHPRIPSTQRTTTEGRSNKQKSDI